MVRSSKRSGHSPFKAEMLGSSPARITITMGYSQGVKAPVFDTGTAGSNPAIPAMIRYSSGSRGQSAKLLIAGWRQKLQPIKKILGKQLNLVTRVSMLVAEKKKQVMILHLMLN